MRMQRVIRAAVATALVAGLAAPAPAFAVVVPPAGRGPVTNNVTVNGVSLTGLAEADARAEILEHQTKPSMPALQVRFGRSKRTFYPRTTVSVDVDTMLNQAYSVPTTTAAFELHPTFKVDAKAINVWVGKVAKKIDRAAKNAKRYVKKRKLYVVRSADGLRTDKKKGARDIYWAVRESANTSGTPHARIQIKVTTLKPKVTTAKLGKCIVVIEGTRKLTLYKAGSTRVEKRYRCAVGMAHYPTPKGTFTIIDKVKNPDWTNPGSDWAKDMPPYIGPGPSNPLGTRALYLSAPGIRIHGTNNVNSIGTAASHGCMRMKRHDVEDLYPRVPIGTTVYIVR